MSQIVHDEQYIAGGHAQVTVADSAYSLFTSNLSLIQRLSTVTGKTDTKISATKIRLSAIDYPIYYTLDGTDPTVTGGAGHPLAVGQDLEIKGWRNIKDFKMIRQGDTTAKVNVTPFFLEAGV